MANCDVPMTLKHKPIVALDYAATDETAGAGDAWYLSIGKAQWDESGEDISAKVIRRVNDRYSPQSEELPLWRVLDLAIMVVAAIKGQQSSLKETPVPWEDFDYLKKFLRDNRELYDPRLNELRRLLSIE